MRHFFGLCLSFALCVSATHAEEFAPGQTFRDCPDCPEMVVIPAGEFLMGTPESPGMWTAKGRNIG